MLSGSRYFPSPERLSPWSQPNTGEIVLVHDQMNSGYVQLLLDFDRLIGLTNGDRYCLTPDRKHSVAHTLKVRCGSSNVVVLVRGQISPLLSKQAAEPVRPAAASHGPTSDAFHGGPPLAKSAVFLR